MAVVRSPLALRCFKRAIALHTLIHQRHPTPSCGGIPTAERTMDPARMFEGELDRKPGIRELDDYLRLTHRKPGEFLFAGRGGSGSPRRRVGRQRRPRPVEIRHALAPADQGDLDLPTNRPCSSCLATPRSRARSAISASRSTTRSRSRRNSTSEIPGQSCRALPADQSSKCQLRTLACFPLGTLRRRFHGHFAGAIF